MAADGGHGLAGEGELKGRQEAQPEERGGQVEVGDGEDVGRSVAEDGGERETVESGGGRVGGLLLLRDLCPQHGPRVPDAEIQTFDT